MIDHSTLVANSASGGGGAVGDVRGGAWALEDSTITGNQTADTGSAPGGTVLSFGSDLLVVDSTIVGNRSHSVGGIFGYGSTLIGDSIIAANSGSSPDILVPSGATVETAYSLIGDAQDHGTGTLSTHYDITGTTAKPANPDLSPLAHNGGPTETMLPNVGSPVIDAGASLSGLPLPIPITTDQRGQPRVYDFPGVKGLAGGDGADMGATELQPSDLVQTLSSRTGDQRLSVETSGTRVCSPPGSPLSVKFSSTAVKGGAKLRFRSVSVYLDRGVRRRVVVRVKHHKRHRWVYVANATHRQHDTTFELSTAHLRAGTHSIRLVATYTEHLKHHRRHHPANRTVTKTLRANFRTC